MPWPQTHARGRISRAGGFLIPMPLSSYLDCPRVVRDRILRPSCLEGGRTETHVRQNTITKRSLATAYLPCPRTSMELVLKINEMPEGSK